MLRIKQSKIKRGEVYWLRSVRHRQIPFLLLSIVLFCCGLGVELAARARLSVTDIGTVGIGGSFSLQDGPSFSVKALVILEGRSDVLHGAFFVSLCLYILPLY